MKDQDGAFLVDNILLRKLGDRFSVSKPFEPLDETETRELLDSYLRLNRRLARIVKISDAYQMEIREIAEALEIALARERKLKGLIPVCTSCKKIRKDKGFWTRIELYLTESAAEVSESEGLCDECKEKSPPQTREQASAPEGGKPLSFLQALKDDEAEDPVIARFLPLVQDTRMAESRLFSDFRALFEKYVLLARRMRRITRISDIYQAEFHESMDRLAVEAQIDYLTGLLNRRAMVSRLEAEQSRAERHKRSFAVLLVDYDRFKDVNDSFGHAAGDAVLKRGADLVSSVMRKEDSFARWGGEEFLALLPECSAAEAAAVAERLRSTVCKAPVQFRDKEISVSVSVGVAIYRIGEGLAACLERVDKELYTAKAAGRNVSSFEGGILKQKASE